MHSPRGALPEAKRCSPSELCLPHAATQSSGCHPHGWRSGIWQPIPLLKRGSGGLPACCQPRRALPHPLPLLLDTCPSRCHPADVTQLEPHQLLTPHSCTVPHPRSDHLHRQTGALLRAGCHTWGAAPSRGGLGGLGMGSNSRWGRVPRWGEPGWPERVGVFLMLFHISVMKAILLPFPLSCTHASPCPAALEFE